MIQSMGDRTNDGAIMTHDERVKLLLQIESQAASGNSLAIELLGQLDSLLVEDDETLAAEAFAERAW